MPRFDDVIAGYGDFADADLNTVVADLQSAYADDLSIPSAALAERDNLIAQLTADLQATKAANWDLLQSVTAADPDPADLPGTNDDGDDENITTDDLFGDDETDK